jgi:hypothetical protein
VVLNKKETIPSLLLRREKERVVQVKGGFKAYSTKVARNKAARKRKATLNKKQ